MGTKTEDYLKILAEGGDAPTSCCMTNTQKLIAEAIERINNLQPGGGEALTINIGSTTYTYDGSEPVTITILDGENTEF